MKNSTIQSVAILLLFSFLSFTLVAQEDVKLTEFGNAFGAALGTRNIDNLITLRPSVDQWRKILPNETKKMTDEQIIKLAIKNEKFVTDFNNILASADKHKIDLTQLKFTSATLQPPLSPKDIMQGADFKYSIEGNEVIFSLSLLKYEDNYYFSEILLSYDIFARYFFKR